MTWAAVSAPVPGRAGGYFWAGGGWSKEWDWRRPSLLDPDLYVRSQSLALGLVPAQSQIDSWPILHPEGEGDKLETPVVACLRDAVVAAWLLPVTWVVRQLRIWL